MWLLPPKQNSVSGIHIRTVRWTSLCCRLLYSVSHQKMDMIWENRLSAVGLIDIQRWKKMAAACKDLYIAVSMFTIWAVCRFKGFQPLKDSKTCTHLMEISSYHIKCKHQCLGSHKGELIHCHKGIIQVWRDHNRGGIIKVWEWQLMADTVHRKTCLVFSLSLCLHSLVIQADGQEAQATEDERVKDD